METYLVAGLGNPAGTYEKTRHNAGFVALDYVSEETGIRLTQKKFKAVFGTGTVDGARVILVKPQTFMNLSGEAVRPLADFYKVPADHVIVLCDDINLEPGSIRVRPGGSAGGHNGIKNIIAHLGTQDFPRVRIGVGGKPQGWDLADYVLAKMTPEEQQTLNESCRRACGAVRTLITDGTDRAMNLYNIRTKKSDDIRAKKSDDIQTQKSNDLRAKENEVSE